MWRLFLLLLITSCQTTYNLTPQHTGIRRTDSLQAKITQVVHQDAENKMWARIYLSEIDSAMLNDDMTAYVFFVGEFEKIPLEIVPVEYRKEPGYIKGPSDLELHFRLRWFEQAVLLYKQHSNE